MIWVNEQLTFTYANSELLRHRGKLNINIYLQLSCDCVNQSMHGGSNAVLLVNESTISRNLTCTPDIKGFHQQSKTPLMALVYQLIEFRSSE